jgi:hypothetical protein
LRFFDGGAVTVCHQLKKKSKQNIKKLNTAKSTIKIKMSLPQFFTFNTISLILSHVHLFFPTKSAVE